MLSAACYGVIKLYILIYHHLQDIHTLNKNSKFDLENKDRI